MSLSSNHESAVINTIAKEASLPFTVTGSTDQKLLHDSGNNTDHGYPHGLPQHHVPLDLNTVSGGGTNHGH